MDSNTSSFHPRSKILSNDPVPPDGSQKPAEDLQKLSSALQIPAVAWVLASFLLASVSALPAVAEEKKGGGDLASQANNPAAVLIQARMQDIYTPSSQNSEGYANSAILQTVYPIVHGKDHYFQSTILRLTMPVVATTPKINGNRTTGIGDANLLIVPAHKQPVGDDGGFWNFGPVLAVNIPTASQDETGSGQWEAGPGALVLRDYKNVFSKGDNLLLGALGYQQWSFAGESDRADVSNTFGQPIIVYNFADLFDQKGWYAANPDDLWQYNWEQSEFIQIPLGLRIGRVFSIGKQPVNIFAQSWYNPVESDSGVSADYTIKLNFTMLFPE